MRWSRILAKLSPPEDAAKLHRALEAASLAMLDQDQLQSFGLSGSDVHEHVWDSRDIGDAAGQAGALFDSMREGNWEWPAAFESLMPEDGVWTDLICVDFLIANEVLPEEVLSSGPVGLRISTLLDLAGVGATPVDIQAEFANRCQLLSDAKVSGAQLIAVTAGGIGGQIAWGWLTGSTVGPASAAAVRVLDWLTSEDETVRTLAHLWLLYDLLPEGDEERRHEIIREVRNESQAALRRGAGQHHRAARYLLEGPLSQLTTKDESLELPDLAGMELSNALQLLDDLGVHDVLYVDLAESKGFFRTLVSADEVCGMSPPSGSPVVPGMRVVLATKHRGDRVRDPIIRAALADAQRG